MALSPISTYASPDNSLIQLLKGGSGEITSIMDKAIQIGKDISNKQLAQEQDLLSIRKNETALAQRRAEELQQNNEDAMKFARNAYEFDTKFNSDSAFRQQQQSRQGEQDLFSNQQSEARLGLAQNADTRAAADQRLQEQKFNLEKANQEKNLSYYAEEYGDKPQTAPAAAPDLYYQPTKPNQSPVSARPTDTPAPAAETYESLYAEREKLQSDLSSAPKNSALRSRIATRVGTVEGKIAALKGTGALKEQTPEQKAAADRAAQDQQFQISDRAAKEAEMLIGDTAAFIPATTLMAGEVAPTDETKLKDYNKRAAEANAYDKDRFSSEVNSAKNMSREAYVQKVPNATAAQKAKRMQLWDYANASNSPVPATTTNPSGNPAQAKLDILLGS